MPAPVISLNDLIREAQKACGVPRNARLVVAQMLFGKIWKKATANDDIHRHVMREGFDQLTRKFLKQVQEDDADTSDDDITVEQLDLWPDEAKRQLVKNIERVRVYVPSRGEYVDLRPDRISRPETIEAGGHLISHGADCTRRGKLLVELGKLPGSWA